MKMCVYFCLFIAQTRAGIAFTDAADAKDKIESMLAKIVSKMEGSYVDLASEEGGSCSFVPSCDPSSSCTTATGSNVWTQSDTMSRSQFNNPTSKTCTRFDKDPDNEFLPAPVTGRKNTCSASTCAAGTLCQDDDNKDTCKCRYPVVLDTRDKVYFPDIFPKPAWLDSKGCTKSDQQGLCYTNDKEYPGVNLVDDNMKNNGYSCRNKISELSKRVNGEICATNQLRTQFQSNANAHSDLKWNFMGLQETGMYRNWPLIYQCRTESQCSGCSDPRFRSWYASAASGPKDVIMVIDRSGSMTKNNRMAKLKKAAQWVVNTLSENDYAQVVSYAGDADSNGDVLVQMDTVNRAKMKEHIGGLEPYGRTNMALGLRRAFDIAEKSWGKGAGGTKLTAGCGRARIIMFLTDGENTGDEDPLATVNTLNQELNLRVFTYTLGDGAGGSKQMLKNMACQNEGVWQHIPDSADNLKEIMAGYFLYLAAGVSKPGARWSDWFEDGQGLGQITGACSAVFDRTKEAATGVAVLFGVICQSIHKDRWSELSDNAATWAKIQAENKKCPDLSLTEAQLEILRSKINPAAACAYSGTAYVSTPAPPIYPGIAVNGLLGDENAAGSTSAGVAIILSLSAALILLVQACHA